MSRSRSSQSSVVNNHNINNVLDGGAIKSSFDFATGIAEEAFDSVNSSVGQSAEMVEEALKLNKEITGSALTINQDVTHKAIDANTQVIDEAFDNNNFVTQAALESLREQNNRSLDALAGLQGQQATTNFELLKGIQSTVNSSNTGGASEVLANQKFLYIVMALMVLGLFVLGSKKGK